MLMVFIRNILLIYLIGADTLGAKSSGKKSDESGLEFLREIGDVLSSVLSYY